LSGSKLLRTTAWIVAATIALSSAKSATAETLCGPEADVEVGTAVVIGLATGDTLVATFTECDDGAAVVDHQLLGTLHLASEDITRVVAGKPGENVVIDVRTTADGDAPEVPSTVDGAVDADVAAGPDPAAEAEPTTQPWESEAEFGLNGSTGNSDRLSFRLGARAKHTNERRELRLEAMYTRSDEDTDGDGRETTENKGLVRGNNDWLFPESQWRYFVGGSAEYDEFQNYDARVAINTGPGYMFIENDTTTLIGRAGIGTSWKIGGEDEDGFFELVFGYELEHALTENQKIVSAARLFPNMTETGEFRAVALLAYDVKLATPAALTLRLGAENRYDSTIEDSPPDEFDKNDLDYYVTLIWDF
jgi:putative salt-induced outer membrane protein YdiY